MLAEGSREMSDEPANAKATALRERSKLVLNCGNIASWSKLKKRAILTSTEELLSTVENTLTSHLGSKQLRDEGKAIITNKALAQRLTADERSNLMVTLKVFISDWSGTTLTDAVKTSLRELGISSVDTLIVAFPPCPDTEITLERMQPVWQGVEQVARDGLAERTGTADLDKACLEQLYHWASLKPKVNQYNLAHCCTMPEDLVEFAKQVDIQLLTHNDERDILPLAPLHQTLTSAAGGEWPSWKWRWVSRYNSVIKLRGIVSHRGYVLELEDLSPS